MEEDSLTGVKKVPRTSFLLPKDVNDPEPKKVCGADVLDRSTLKSCPIKNLI